MTEPTPENTDLGFDAAMAELREILVKLEADQVGLDGLSTLVERAAFLVKHCRARIARTELQVQEIITELAEP